MREPADHSALLAGAAASRARGAYPFRLAVCNDKKSPGLNIIYKSEEGYLGEDSADIFLIFPDGSAAEWHYVILVR